MRKYGMLAQDVPAASSLEDCYTVPLGKHATVRVIACNLGAETTFRIAVSPAGAAIDDAHYIAYGPTLEANDSVSSVAVTVSATDVVRCWSASGSVAFSVTGIEDDN